MNRLHVALLLLAAGCQSDPDAAPPEKPSGGKSDDPARICVALGEPATCDVCDVAGWYGDGECDRFCENPDSDCPAQPTTATEFLALMNVPVLKTTGGGFGERTTTLVATSLSTDDVTGWLNDRASMIGTGYALHMRFRHFVGNVDWNHTIAIDDHRNSNGNCVQEDLTNYADTHFAIAKWDAASYEIEACPIGGSIRVYANTGDHGPVEVRFNILWSDGTAWTSRTMIANDLEPL